MNPRQRNQAILAGASAAGAFVTSITGLVQLAAKVHMPTWDLAGVTIPIGAIGLVLCVDGLTIAAAYAAHGPDRDGWTILLLLVATAASAGAQGWAAEPVRDLAGVETVDIWIVRALHMAPAAMALGAGWLAIRSFHVATPAKPQRKPSPKTVETKKTAETTPPVLTSSAPAQVEPAVEVKPVLHAVPEPRDLTDDQIAELVDEWLADAKRNPSKESVKAAGEALNLPCRGNQRALDVARLIRERRARAS